MVILHFVILYLDSRILLRLYRAGFSSHIDVEACTTHTIAWFIGSFDIELLPLRLFFERDNPIPLPCMFKRLRIVGQFGGGPRSA